MASASGSVWVSLWRGLGGRPSVSASASGDAVGLGVGLGDAVGLAVGFTVGLGDAVGLGVGVAFELGMVAVCWTSLIWTPVTDGETATGTPCGALPDLLGVDDAADCQELGLVGVGV